MTHTFIRPIRSRYMQFRLCVMTRYTIAHNRLPTFFMYWPGCPNGPETEILYNQKPLNARLGIQTGFFTKYRIDHEGSDFFNLNISILFYFFRDIREYKSRVESYSREMLRKEAQIRDMTQRLENGDGSKFILFCISKGVPPKLSTSNWLQIVRSML